MRCPTTAGRGTARWKTARVDSEQNRAATVPLSFAAPSRPSTPAVDWRRAARCRRHAGREPRPGGCNRQASPRDAGTTAADAMLVVRTFSGEGTRLASRSVALRVPPGLHVHQVDVPTAGLAAGGYSVTWDLGDGRATGRLGLSVLAAASVIRCAVVWRQSNANPAGQRDDAPLPVGRGRPSGEAPAAAGCRDRGPAHARPRAAGHPVGRRPARCHRPAHGHPPAGVSLSRQSVAPAVLGEDPGRLRSNQAVSPARLSPR